MSNVIKREDYDKRKAHIIDTLPPPVVRYSKYKIQIAAQKRGLWDRLKEAIAAAGLADSWTNVESKELTSDNEQLVAALPAIRQAFGSELVDEVLSECVAD